jgi:hypothetical protein
MAKRLNQQLFVCNEAGEHQGAGQFIEHGQHIGPGKVFYEQADQFGVLFAVFLCRLPGKFNLPVPSFFFQCIAVQASCTDMMQIQTE